MTTAIHCNDITFDSPGNNDRAIVHCEQADGRGAEVHFDITLDVARVRYAVIAGEGTVLFPDDEITAPAKDALRKKAENKGIEVVN